MIRPFTLITMLLAALSGAYLFAVKHRAQVLDDQLAATAQNSRLDAQRIRVLQAQWAQEIDPTRLAQLAAQFTSLQPMLPAQMVALASLSSALPAPNSPPPGANPEDDAPGLLAARANAMVAGKSALPLPPALPPADVPARTAAPIRLASVTQTHPHAQTHSMLHLAQTRAVETLAPPRALPFSEPAGTPAPQPLMGAQLVSAKIVSPMADNGGSALGMAADLAPPQPLPESLPEAGSGN